MGSKVTLRDWSVPCSRVTPAAESSADTSEPIVAVKGPVLRAGEGLVTPPIDSTTSEIAELVVIAPDIVIIRVGTSTLTLIEVIATELMRIKLQLYIPDRVNSSGKVTVMVDPAGTGYVSQGVISAVADSCLNRVS